MTIPSSHATFVTVGKSIFELQGLKNFSNRLPTSTPPIAKKAEEGKTRTDDEKLIKFFGGSNFVPWGEDNNYPANALKDVWDIPLAMRSLKFRQDVHFGKGTFLFKELIDGTSETIKKIPQVNAEITAFFKATQINKLLFGLINDWETLRNIFPEIILNEKGDKINKVYRQPAPFCRWKQMNKKHKVEGLWISSNWAGMTHRNEVYDLPCLDWDNPIEDLRDRMKAKSKDRRFILPMRLEEFDQIYYDFPYWDPIRKTWFEVAYNIPQIKKAMLKNQMVLKFHIKIPYSFWTFKFKNWGDLDEAEQKKHIDALLTDMDNFLTNNENYGKSFISHYGTDPMDPTKVCDEIKIETIDNTKFVKDGSYITDAKSANGEIVTSFGVDPALIGGFLPGGSEAGSGSNKREALAIHQAQISPDRYMTLKWFEHVQDYNGWNPELKVGYMDLDTSQTLNENPTGKKIVG